MIFLSNKESEVLETLLIGFKKLLENGEYERLFLQFYQSRFTSSKVSENKAINPIVLAFRYPASRQP